MVRFTSTLTNRGISGCDETEDVCVRGGAWGLGRGSFFIKANWLSFRVSLYSEHKSSFPLKHARIPSQRLSHRGPFLTEGMLTEQQVHPRMELHWKEDGSQWHRFWGRLSWTIRNYQASLESTMTDELVYQSLFFTTTDWKPISLLQELWGRKYLLSQALDSRGRDGLEFPRPTSTWDTLPRSLPRETLRLGQ